MDKSTHRLTNQADIHPLYRQRVQYVNSYNTARGRQPESHHSVQYGYGSPAEDYEYLQEQRAIHASMASPSVNVFGLSGISNVGNTCYLNSAIQALAHTYFFTQKVFDNKEEFSKILLTNAPKIFEKNVLFTIGIRSEIPEYLKAVIRSPAYNPDSLRLNEKAILLNHTLTFQLIKLLEMIWVKNQTINPLEFIKIFWTVRGGFFKGFRQHDAEEAYSAILDQIQTELQQDKNIEFPGFKEKIGEFSDKRKQLFDAYKNLKEVYPEEAAAFQRLAQGKEANIPALFDEFVRQRERILNEDFELKRTNPEAHTIYNSMIALRNYYTTKHTELTVLFTSFSLSTLRCPKPSCGFSSIKFEPLMYVPLPLPCALPGVQEQCTLQMCIDEYCKEERLNADNRWKCDRCNERVQALKKIQLWSCPPVLCIQLKRFIGADNKIEKSVQFPLDNLDISSMVNKLNMKDSVNHYRYTLQCVINHRGSMKVGHYYTYCKHETSGKWFEFNDSRVTEIATPVSSAAYVLYYVRKDVLKE